ncbi:MAG: anhydro-N-acetylmuramic acid kinase [bacterium]
MKAIGLMSGTSLDGVDAALVDISRTRWGVRAELLSFYTLPFSGETVRMILEASNPSTGRTDLVARLNFYLGELFAQAAHEVMRLGGVRPLEVEHIGSHGQTIQHLPDPVKIGKTRVSATLQVGEPSVIAARTGITTVADFRPADMAAGGEGAPLVPYVDYLLFRNPKRSRFLVNIGGICNGTFLPAGAGDPEAVRASDIGPGNMVIDELVQRMTNFRESYDRDGRHAAKGKVNHKLLSELLKTGFFAKPPPKSTGRERFGADFVDSIIESAGARNRRGFLDLIATAVELTAESIHRHYRRFHSEETAADEVIVSGGGAKNLVLMQSLSAKFDPVPVAASDEYGVPAAAKEAMAFAILGMETLKKRPGNLTGATGAKKRAVLGKIVPPPG